MLITRDIASPHGLEATLRELVATYSVPDGTQPTAIYALRTTGPNQTAVEALPRDADPIETLFDAAQADGIVIIDRADPNDERIAALRPPSASPDQHMMLVYAICAGRDLFAVVTMAFGPMDGRVYTGEPLRPAAVGTLPEVAQALLWGQQHRHIARYTVAEVYSRALASSLANTRTPRALMRALRWPAIAAGPGIPVATEEFLTKKALKQRHPNRKRRKSVRRARPLGTWTWQTISNKISELQAGGQSASLCAPYRDVHAWRVPPRGYFLLPVEVLGNALGDRLPSMRESRRRLFRRFGPFGLGVLTEALSRYGLPNGSSDGRAFMPCQPITAAHQTTIAVGTGPTEATAAWRHQTDPTRPRLIDQLGGRPQWPQHTPQMDIPAPHPATAQPRVQLPARQPFPQRADTSSRVHISGEVNTTWNPAGLRRELHFGNKWPSTVPG